MEERLLVSVSDRFALSRGVLAIAPLFAWPDSEFQALRIGVRLVRPDGTERHCEASLEPTIFRVDGRGVYRVQLALEDMSPDDVPLGTEVYTSAKEAPRLELAA